MIKSTLRYFARRSHDVRVQTLLAAVHGLVDIFGVFGTVAIIFKLRKSSKSPMVLSTKLKSLMSVTAFFMAWLCGVAEHYVQLPYYSAILSVSSLIAVVYINFRRK